MILGAVSFCLHISTSITGKETGTKYSNAITKGIETTALSKRMYADGSLMVVFLSFLTVFNIYHNIHGENLPYYLRLKKYIILMVYETPVSEGC